MHSRHAAEVVLGCDESDGVALSSSLDFTEEQYSDQSV